MPMHTVTFLFSQVRSSTVFENLFTNLLFECAKALGTNFFGQLWTGSGSKLSLKMLFFGKQLCYFDNPHNFNSLWGLLGIQLTTKIPILTFLKSYPRNGDPTIFKKVQTDKNFWFVEFLKQ